MRKLYLLSTLVLSLTVCSTGANAQDFSNKGSEFWFCFPNHIPSGASTGAMSIWITSDQASSGKISMTNGTFNATFSVAANGITSVNIATYQCIGEKIFCFQLHLFRNQWRRAKLKISVSGYCHTTVHTGSSNPHAEWC